MSNLLNEPTALAIVLAANVAPSRAHEVEMEIYRECLGLMRIDGRSNEYSEILYFGKSNSKGVFIVLVRLTPTSSELPDPAASCDIVQLLCKIDRTGIQVTPQFFFKPTTL
jgi:hypothetical protein